MNKTLIIGGLVIALIITIIIVVFIMRPKSAPELSSNDTISDASSVPAPEEQISSQAETVPQRDCPTDNEVIYSKYYFYGPKIAHGKKISVSKDNIRTINGDTYYIVYERPYTKIIRESDRVAKYYTGLPSNFNISNFSRYATMNNNGYLLGEDPEFTDKTNFPVDIPNTIKAVDKVLTEKREFISYSKLKNFSYNSLKSIGAWVKLNKNVLDAERPGIIMGNYPETANTNLNIEIHQNRKPRIYINMGALDWLVNDNIPLDTWVHIAFVLKNNSIEYYRDGVLKQTLERIPPTIGLINNIKFGYDNRGSPFYGKFKIKNVLVGNTEWSTTDFENILKGEKQLSCSPKCNDNEFRDKDLEECVCANKYDKLSTGFCEQPCPSDKLRDENDMCIDWVINGSNGWSYVRGIFTAVRVNRNGDVECASNNGKDCLWRGSEIRTLEDINNPSFNPTLPLACGEDSKSKWGDTGYGNENHWCSISISKLDPTTSKIIQPPSAFIRYTKRRNNYLIY